MEDTKKAYNRELVVKYPFLMPPGVQDDYDYSFVMMKYHIPPGWWKAFGINMCEEIKSELIKEGGEELLYKARVYECKEKYNSLRTYIYPSSETLDKILEKYEHISGRYCVKCGEAAEFVSNGYYLSYCRKCAEKHWAENSHVYINKSFDKNFMTIGQWFGEE